TYALSLTTLFRSALDQLQSEPVFQRGQGLRKRGLAHIETRGGRTEMAMFGDGDEGTQLREGWLIRLIGHPYQCSATYHFCLLRVAWQDRRRMLTPPARSAGHSIRQGVPPCPC